MFEDPKHRAKLEEYVAAIARVLQPLDGKTILEAGVGEATTLCGVLNQLHPAPERVFGFDLAWSRIAIARAYAKRETPCRPQLCTGDFFATPFADGAFDIVFTSHAVEPNFGREEEALRELYRVARRWVVLFEPSYELGNEATKRHIEEHGYCRGLTETAKRLGYRVVEYRLLDLDWVDYNQTGVIVIEKPESGTADASRADYACPRCHHALVNRGGNYFCSDCLVVYPQVGGIPCLLPQNAILATKYLDVTPA